MVHWEKALAVFTSVASLAGCAHYSDRSAPSEHETPKAVSRAEHEIRKVAAGVAHEYITPLNAEDLVRAAVRGLDESSRPAGALPGEGGSPDLATALERQRARGIGDAYAVSLAVAAIAKSLGDGARFIPQPEWQRQSTQPAGTGAIGFVLKRGEANAAPSILRVLPGTPAADAALERGTELRAVDGRQTAGLPLDAVVDLLKGPEESETTLTVARHGEPERMITLRRRRIDVNAVDCRIIEGRVLYLGIAHLNARTVDRVREAATAVVRGAPGEPPAAVVLDLRGNAGGLLETTQALADEFIASGPIFTVETRGAAPARVVATSSGSWLERTPLVVLVDGATGSGAELIAAAVQDDGRGKVFGVRTSGRARVERLHETTGGMLRFMTGHLLRASGADVNGRGVTPDVTLDAAAPATLVRDAACPGPSSPTSVGDDPLVAAAVASLLAP